MLYIYEAYDWKINKINKHTTNAQQQLTSLAMVTKTGIRCKNALNFSSPSDAVAARHKLEAKLDIVKTHAPCKNGDQN